MPSDAGYIVVTTTVEDDLDAKKRADRLLRARLAACVHITKIKSIYRWKGQIDDIMEYQLRIKTSARHQEAIIAFIKNEHTYEVPQITVTPMTGGNAEYLDWIDDETSDS